MNNLFDIVKDFAENRKKHHVVTKSRCEPSLRVIWLTTDGTGLYAAVFRPRYSNLDEDMYPSIDVTDSWVFDATDGQLLYGTPPAYD
jgi:hypothetical protein